MLRVVHYLEWKEEDWRAKGDQSMRGLMSETETEGYRAYVAERHASIFRSLANHFRGLWDVPAHVSRMQDIITSMIC